MKTRLVPIAAALLLPWGAHAAPQDPDVHIDPRADAAMHRMSDYLSGLRAFRVHGASATDMVTKDGQKIQFVVDQNVEIKRPNHMRAERRDPKVDATVRYDGKNFSVFNKDTNYWASVPAPPQMTEAVDMLRNRYGIEAPAADLFLEHPYAEMMENVTAGHYLGIEPIDGVPCEHLAFQGKDVDWQIWIQQGAQPLPRRYVITSKNEASQPQFAVALSNWQPNAAIADSDFTFQPPAGSKRIELRPISQQRSARRAGGVQ